MDEFNTTCTETVLYLEMDNPLLKKCTIKNKIMHELYQILLINFLSSGGIINICNSCDICRRETCEKINVCYSYKKDIILTDCNFVFDVVGLDSKDRIIFGLNIRYTNDRMIAPKSILNYCKYYEISSRDIDKEFEYSIVPNVINLIEQRSYKCNLCNSIYPFSYDSSFL